MTVRPRLEKAERTRRRRPASSRFDRYTSKGMAAARYLAQRVLLGAVVRSVITVHILGRERLTELKGAFVVVANHSSHLDAPLIFTTLPRRLARYLSAGAAADYFFDVRWRKGLTALFFNAFPIHRSGVDRPTSEARALLQRGVPLLVFPEGTRSKTGRIGQFKSGAAALATSEEVPVLPVAIIGASIAHPRGSRWPKAGRLPVGIVFGDPVFAQVGETAPEYMRRVRREVQRLHDEHVHAVLAPGRARIGGPR